MNLQHDRDWEVFRVAVSEVDEARATLIEAAEVYAAILDRNVREVAAHGVHHGDIGQWFHISATKVGKICRS